MKKKLFILILSIFLINLVSGMIICVDKTPPTPPSNLAVSGEVGNIVLTWDASTDVPDCSGIDYYTISRNGTYLGNTTADILTFTDTDDLEIGWYNYTVYATDKVGHNNGSSIKNEIKIIKDNGGGGHVGGGGGGTSYVCEENWKCSDWTECYDSKQTRRCEDLEKCGTTNDKPAETKSCVVEEQGFSELPPEETKKQTAFSKITGAVTGTVPGTIVVSVFLIGLIALAITVRIVRKRKRL